MVCPDGCVGGPLVVENRFLAKSRILELVTAAGRSTVVDRTRTSTCCTTRISCPSSIPSSRSRCLPSMPIPAGPSGKPIKENDLIKRLPHKDCGACGAPDCRTLADDIVRGEAALTDCPFMNKEGKR